VQFVALHSEAVVLDTDSAAVQPKLVRTAGVLDNRPWPIIRT